MEVSQCPIRSRDINWNDVNGRIGSVFDIERLDRNCRDEEERM